jgi:hypothetical protein
MQLINIFAVSVAFIYARQVAGLPQPVCYAPEVTSSTQPSKASSTAPEEMKSSTQPSEVTSTAPEEMTSSSTAPEEMTLSSTAPDETTSSAQWKRPRVFMCMHGSNALANDNSTDDQWTYVREHIEGVWGNHAGFDFEDEALLFSKINTRNTIAPVQLSPDIAHPWTDLDTYAPAQSHYPELELNREAVAIFTPDPSEWNGKTIADAEQEFVTNPSAPEWMRYKSVMTGWVPNAFITPLQGDAEAAFQQGKGAFVECQRDACSMGILAQRFTDVMKAQHAKGDPFIWFSGNHKGSEGNWPMEFQAQYNFIRDQGLWRENDIVMIINYQESFPALPETNSDGEPADTVTGMMYWALHQ